MPGTASESNKLATQPNTTSAVIFPLHRQNVILDNGITYVLDRSVDVRSIVIQNYGTFLYLSVITCAQDMHLFIFYSVTLCMLTLYAKTEQELSCC